MTMTTTWNGAVLTGANLNSDIAAAQAEWELRWSKALGFFETPTLTGRPATRCRWCG